MATTTNCTECGKPLRVKDQQAGKRIRCPNCGRSYLPTDKKASPAKPAPTKASAMKKPAAKKNDAVEAPRRGFGMVLLLGAAALVLIGLLAVGGFAAFWYGTGKDHNDLLALVVAKEATPKKPAPLVADKKTTPEEKKTPVEKEEKTPVDDNKTDPVKEKTDPVKEKKTDPVEEKKKDPVEEKKKDPVEEKKMIDLTPKRVEITSDARKKYPREIDWFEARIGELTVRKAVPSAFTHRPLWHPDGKSFYAVQLHAHIFHLDATDCSGIRDHLHYEGKKPVYYRGGLAWSSEGILALGTNGHETRGGDIELMILDPITFRTKKKIACPNAGLVVCVPSLSYAFAGGINSYPDGKVPEFMIVDLKTGAVTRPDLGHNLDLRTFHVSPDGKYFFATDCERIVRFRIDEGKLVHDGSSPALTNMKGLIPHIEVSVDGKYVILQGHEAREDVAPSVRKAFTVPASQIDDKARAIKGAYTSVGWDPRDKEFVASTLKGLGFLAADADNEPPALHDCANGLPRRIYMCPTGGSMLLQSGPDLYLARWSARD